MPIVAVSENELFDNLLVASELSEFVLWVT